MYIEKPFELDTVQFSIKIYLQKNKMKQKFTLTTI